MPWESKGPIFKEQKDLQRTREGWTLALQDIWSLLQQPNSGSTSGKQSQTVCKRKNVTGTMF